MTTDPLDRPGLKTNADRCFDQLAHDTGKNPAVQWLDTVFTGRWALGTFRDAELVPGPKYTRPMIELIDQADDDDFDNAMIVTRSRLRRPRPVVAMTARTQSTDYYAVLGVSPDATTAQIKRAYRKLARQHHPDRNPGDPCAANRFQAITMAYEVLTDPDRRAVYDATRPVGPNTLLSSRRTMTRPSAASSRYWKTLWRIIRARHGELPPVVIIIASGTDRKQHV